MHRSGPRRKDGHFYINVCAYHSVIAVWCKISTKLTTLGGGLVSWNCREQSTDRLSSALLEVFVVLADTG